MENLFLTTSQAAHVLNISPRTLERWRIEGYGPAFVKFGARALYSRDGLMAWASIQTRNSTSESDSSAEAG